MGVVGPDVHSHHPSRARASLQRHLRSASLRQGMASGSYSLHLRFHCLIDLLHSVLLLFLFSLNFIFFSEDVVDELKVVKFFKAHFRLLFIFYYLFFKGIFFLV